MNEDHAASTGEWTSFWRRAPIAPHLAQEFARFEFDKRLPLTQITLGLTAVLYAAFGWLDLKIVPEAVHALWIIRYAVFCPCAALVLGLSFTRGFRGFAQPLLGSLAAIAGLGIVAMIALANATGGYLYYAGLMLVVFCAYGLIQLRFRWAALVCLVIVSAYEVVAIRVKHTPLAILLNNNFFFIAANVIGAMSALIHDQALRVEFRQRGIIELQRRQAEALLLNVLPAPIADRLKREERHAIVDQIEQVTVLFADCVGFTQLSERLTPAELLAMLNEVFTTFDQLAEKHRLEKIKTIGDAYMVAGGVPLRQEGHVEAVAEMALDMLAQVPQFQSRLGVPLQIRIGIHTGPVIAGIIGLRKFTYDLWGDTVNTASRMESHGLPGCIQITEAVRARLGDRFVVEDRGAIQVKGKGELRAYLLTGRTLARTG